MSSTLSDPALPASARLWRGIRLIMGGVARPSGPAGPVKNNRTVRHPEDYGAYGGQVRAFRDDIL